MVDGPCVLVCWDCVNGADAPIEDYAIPFNSYAERGKWAAAHTKGTGHDSWWCLDSIDSAAGVRVGRLPITAEMVEAVNPGAVWWSNLLQDHFYANYGQFYTMRGNQRVRVFPYDAELWVPCAAGPTAPVCEHPEAQHNEQLMTVCGVCGAVYDEGWIGES